MDRLLWFNSPIIKIFHNIRAYCLYQPFLIYIYIYIKERKIYTSHFHLHFQILKSNISFFYLKNSLSNLSSATNTTKLTHPSIAPTMASILRDRFRDPPRDTHLAAPKGTKSPRDPCSTTTNSSCTRSKTCALPIWRSGFEPHGLRAPIDRPRDPCLGVPEHRD